MKIGSVEQTMTECDIWSAQLGHDLVTWALMRLFLSIWEVHVVIPRFCKDGASRHSTAHIDTELKDLPTFSNAAPGQVQCNNRGCFQDSSNEASVNFSARALAYDLKGLEVSNHIEALDQCRVPCSVRSNLID